jgi:hypothetical protein
VGSPAKNALEGLRDAEAERTVLAGLERGLLLHGHLHRRLHRTIPTERGRIDELGSTSSSLLHDDLDRVGGLNLYDIDDDGTLIQVSALRWERSREQLVPADVPRA